VPGGTSTLGLPATVTVPGFCRVVQLAMAAALPNNEPSLFAQYSQQLRHFHCGILRRGECIGQFAPAAPRGIRRVGHALHFEADFLFVILAHPKWRL